MHIVIQVLNMHLACVDTHPKSEEVDRGDQDLHMLFDRITGNIIGQHRNLGGEQRFVQHKDAIRGQAQGSLHDA